MPLSSSFLRRSVTAGGRLALAILATCLAVATGMAQDKQDLRGRVTATNGQVIAGARVIVISAKAREGVGVTMPNAHPDCGKRATTDARGEFILPEVDPELLYKLLVTAPGFRPTFVDKADPLAGLTRVKLKPPTSAGGPAERQILGRVYDPDGQPVAGAVLEVDAVEGESYTTYGGSSRYLESVAITDESGTFVFHPTSTVRRASVKIDASRLARQSAWLGAGDAHVIRLRRGTTITGRLLNNDKPAADVTVAVCTKDRSTGDFLRGFEVSTDASGRFTLANIPAGHEWNLFSKMESLQDLGLALPIKTLRTGADGTTNHLGDLRLEKAFQIRGHVVLAGGGSISKKLTIYMSRNEAWDTENIPVGPDGEFFIAGVPKESIDLSLRLDGYRVSKKNPSKDWLNEGMITGVVDRNFDDFVIHLEPGRDQGVEDRPSGDSAVLQPGRLPLRSATP